MNRFDLVECQWEVRNCMDPRKVYLIWDDVCRRYERREIGRYELEEMKEVVMPRLAELAALRRQINEKSGQQT